MTVRYLHRIVPDAPNLINQLAAREAVKADEQRDLRVRRWQRIVRAFCIAVAVFAAVVFGGHLLIGAVS